MRTIKYWLGLLLCLASLLVGCNPGGGAAPTPQATLAPTAPAEALARGEDCPDAPGPIQDGIVLNREGNLVSMSADGQRSIALTTLPPPLRTYAPLWSPDGQTLAYVFFFMHPDPALNGWLQISIICALDRQSGQGRVLARGPSDADALEEFSWARDGRALLLTHRRFIFNEQREVLGGETAITRYDLESGALTALVPGGFMPALSPDGERLAYIKPTEDGNGRVLMLAQADGQQPRPLLSDQSQLRMPDSPRWSPDGQRLLFTAMPAQPGASTTPSASWLDELLGAAVARAHGDPAHLWIASADGQKLEQLTSTALDDPHGAWGADGTQVVYVTTLGPVVLLDLNSRAERQLSDQGFSGLIDWSWKP